MWEAHRFVSFDETPIFYYHLAPRGQERGIALILHGIGEHAGRYHEFARYLAEAGIRCFAPDLRGFGRSGGSRAYVGRFSDFYGDLETLHSFVERNHKTAPIFLIGHSFGGLLASSYLAFHRSTPRVSGLVLVSPIFGIGVHVPSWRHALGIIASYLAPRYSQKSGVQPEMLTHDESVLAAYRKDAYIHHRVTARLYRELIWMLSKRERIASRLRIPVLMAVSGEDKVVSKEAALLFFEKLTVQDKELEIYGSFLHEILNEKDKQVAFLRIRNWIINRIDSNSL